MILKKRSDARLKASHTDWNLKQVLGLSICVGREALWILLAGVYVCVKEY